MATKPKSSSSKKQAKRTTAEGKVSAREARKAATRKQGPSATERSRQRTATPRELTELGKGRTRAKEYVRNRKKTGLLLGEAMKKAARNRGLLAKVWDDLMTLFRLVRAWLKREYTDVPWETMIWIVGAIIYFVNPFDVIPDFIPGFGYVDDAAVIAFVVNSFHTDIQNFRIWEQSRK